MQAYIIRRLLLIIPTIFVASLIVFFLIRFIPGDIVTKMAAQHIGVWKEADSAAVRARLGLDVPIPVQYGRWIGVIRDQHGSFSGLLQGSLGLSLWGQQSVTGIVLNRLPVTFELATLSLIIAVLIALPIGAYSAIRQDTIGDYIARSFGILALSIPGFWLGTMVVVFPSIWWGWSPSIELIRFIDDPLGNLVQYIVPALVLGMIMSGMIMRMTRTMMLEVLRQDYIRTAWSKGLKERMVILRHALRNALIPVITVIGFMIPWVIGGAVVTETIFGLPGLGHLLLIAINDRDYTIVSGVTMFFAGFIMLANLVIDLSYSFLDPRIRV
jgi:peptide/nickel transport system permease protein